LLTLSPNEVSDAERDEAMNCPTTNGQHHHQMMIGSLIALAMLLLLARQASAECAAAASVAGNRATAISRVMEAACNRESVSRTLNRTFNTATLNTTVAGGAHAGGVEAGRWSMAGALSAASVASQHEQNAELETPVQRSLSDVHWADSRDWIHNPPEWVKAARNYKRQGMPIVHLLQSQDKSRLLALGVSNHGKPGLYYTQKLPF
jgi:hypothetical protein